MLLPNEALLGVLLFADFSTLVSAKFVGARFLGVVTANEHLLSIQRCFNVIVHNSYITYNDVMNGRRRKSIRYERADHQSFATACRALADVIGQHVLDKLTFFDSTCIMPGVEIVFDLVPALKFAQDLILNVQEGPQAGGIPESFMRNFAEPKTLFLHLDYVVFRRFSWSFLGLDAARDLQVIKFCGISASSEEMDASVEELVRICVTRPPSGEALELDFSSNYFSRAFGLRIIDLLEYSGLEVVLKMRIVNDLTLDESDFQVNVDGTTKRYASENGGVVVEVTGQWVTIQSTAEVPRKKSRTAEDIGL